MSKTITMLHVKNDSATFKKVTPTLQRYYELIGCDYIDIVEINFGGKTYDVICDDEALLKNPPHYFSVISESGSPMIAGNILICNSKDGYETSLKNDDIIRLLSRLCWTMQNDEETAAIIAD